MKENFLTSKHKTVHISGILGVSTSAIAKHLLLKNYVVSGSDANKNGKFDELSSIGIKTHKGHSGRFVKHVDAIIRSSAISDDNPEIKYAMRKNIPVYGRGQVLGEILSCYKTPIAVSGSHGKTTTTAMIADALIGGGKNPTVFLGGENSSFGNYRSGGEEIVLVEACEYKKNFLALKPKISVLLNIDNDHLDSFIDMEDMVHAFNQFIKGSIAVINADDGRAVNLESASAVTFGIKNNAIYTAKKITCCDGVYSFTAYRYGRPLGKIRLNILGEHNIYNALATISVCDILKIPFYVVKNALEQFNGVKRRAEVIGKVGESICFADYAHHPREIGATIDGFSQACDDFAVVFQPHTYSRTRYLMNDFVDALKSCNELVIYKTYPAREKFDRLGSEKALYNNLCKIMAEKCTLAESKRQLESVVINLSSKYKRILFLGAGDVYDVAINIIKDLNNLEK